MLKLSVTYTDFNDNEISEILYFNLTKSELIGMEVENEGGMAAHFKAMMDANDEKSLFAEIQNFILKSYGVKSEDGRRFIKSEELSEEFSQTAAYDAVFSKMSQDEGYAFEFFKGILPADMQPEMDKAVSDAKTELSLPGQPTIPSAPTPPLPPRTFP